MPGMDDMTEPPMLSLSRLGYGMEIIGSMGDDRRFGLYWNDQQHYIGAILTFAVSSSWSVRLEPAVGLSNVSDHFILRTGVAYMFGGSGSEVTE